MQFSFMVMKIMIATVIRKYRVKTSCFKSIEEIEMIANIVLKPKDGFRLAVESRNL